MSIKKDLLQKIQKKAQERDRRREESLHNKTIESAVFAFFKNAEEARAITNNVSYNPVILNEARKHLENFLRSIDRKVKISIEWTNDEANLIRGVTIWWDRTYIDKHNVHPSLYIDVSQMFLQL